VDDDGLGLLCLEDMAVASAALALLPAADGAAFTAAVTRWRRLMASSPERLDQLLLQPTLARCMQKIEGGEHGSLAPEKIAVALAAFELAAPLQTAPTGIVAAIGRHREGLAALAGPREARDAGALSLTRYTTEREIVRCRPRDINTVAGLSMNFRGPVLALAGPVKVLDSVPDDGNVVVEDGYCLVNGYLFGRVVASGACHVGYNVSGAIIVKQGDISADSLLRRAFVLTKNGRIFCRTAEDPELVFAGSELHIRERTFLGTYAAPRIRVGREIVGGVVAVTDELSAPRIRNGPDRPAAIFLQRALVPEDYGEMLGRDGRVLTTRWVRARQRLVALDQLCALTEADVERMACNAISYLLGGETVRRELEEVRKIERRLAFLERLIAGWEAMNELIGTRAQHARQKPEPEPEPDVDEKWDALDDLRALSDEEMEPEWHQERGELEQLGHAVRRHQFQPDPHANEKKLTWLRERQSLFSRLRQKQADLQRLTARAEQVAGLDLTLSKQRQLAILLETLRSGRGPEWAARAGSVFMRVMLRNIATYRSRADEHARAIAALREQLEALSAALRRDHGIRMELEDSDITPTVTACFEAGVRIWAKRFRDPVTAEEASLLTPASLSQVVTYAREGNAIVGGQACMV
jgi:hypothetical protein